MPAKVLKLHVRKTLAADARAPCVANPTALCWWDLLGKETEAGTAGSESRQSCKQQWSQQSVERCMHRLLWGYPGSTVADVSSGSSSGSFVLLNTWQQNSSEIFKVLPASVDAHGESWNNQTSDICTEGAAAGTGDTTDCGRETVTHRPVTTFVCDKHLRKWG